MTALTPSFSHHGKLGLGKERAELAQGLVTVLTIMVAILLLLTLSQ